MFKKDDIIYIKTTIGLLPHVSGVMAKVLRVNKKAGDIYSVRVEVLEKFSLKDGVEKTAYQTTYRINVTAYEFFVNRNDFIHSVNRTLENFITIAQTTALEVSKGFFK
jgi:hypothetical protein